MTSNSNCYYVRTSFRGIDVLSVVGKMYGRIREGTGVICVEQCGFGRGQSC